MVLRLLSAFALIALGTAARALAAGHGSLYVSTLPPDATVWIDGVYMGETPLFVDDLSGGRHVILLTRAGWQPVSTSADVTIGRVVSVSAVLGQTPATLHAADARGLLRLRDAAGTKVSVDGIALSAPDNPLPLAAGQHILEVTRGKHRSAASFTVYPNTTTTISLAVRQTAAAQGGSTNTSDTLAALGDYVPANDFMVNGDNIIVHVRGIELECSVGSLTYTLNGKMGTLTVAPAMVGNKPFLPLSLLNRIAGNH